MREHESLGVLWKMLNVLRSEHSCMKTSLSLSLLGFTGLVKLVPRLHSVNAEISSSLFQFSNTFLVRTTFYLGEGVWNVTARH